MIEALHSRQPDLHTHLFTLLPEWFFRDSLPGPFSLHRLKSDIGLVQSGPFDEDFQSTLQALAGYALFDPPQVNALAQQVQRLGCQAVVCDIAPLGIAVAQQAGLPSVLIENFTWDWIYEPYLPGEPGFGPYIERFRQVFAQATYHIQTTPVCSPAPTADLVSLPVSRRPRAAPDQVRQRLGLEEDTQLVLVTLGGIPASNSFAANLPGWPNVAFVIPGGSEEPARQENRILLPRRSGFFLPDLVHASQAVVGKAGYSTVAETYQAGIPFAYILRPNFRESPSLGRFIRQYLPSFEIPEAEFEAGAWASQLRQLLAAPPAPRPPSPGASQIADFLLSI